MVKVIFCGCFGRMGNAVRQIIKDEADMLIAKSIIGAGVAAISEFVPGGSGIFTTFL